jgi:hypothetical protein
MLDVWQADYEEGKMNLEDRMARFEANEMKLVDIVNKQRARIEALENLVTADGALHKHTISADLPSGKLVDHIEQVSRMYDHLKQPV